MNFHLAICILIVNSIFFISIYVLCYYAHATSRHTRDSRRSVTAARPTPPDVTLREFRAPLPRAPRSDPIPSKPLHLCIANYKVSLHHCQTRSISNLRRFICGGFIIPSWGRVILFFLYLVTLKTN